MAHGVGLDKAYFFGPLYAYALGLIYAVTASCVTCAIVLQHALGLVLGGLTYALARRWFGRTESLVAAALLVLSGVQVFFEGKLLMEVLVSVLLAASLLMTVDGARAPRPLRFFVAGVLLGLAAAGRPTLLLLAPLVLIPLLRSPARPHRRFLAVLAIYAAGVAVAPTATLVRNLVVEGVPVLITSSGGYNFFAGNARETNGRRQLATDASWNAEDTAETALGRDLDSAEVSRYWFGRALADVRHDPVGWVGRYARKIDLFLGGQDVPQIEWFSYERQRWSVLRHFTLGLRLPMAAALAGMIIMVPRRRDLAFLYGVVLVYAASIALFFVTTRYRVVLLPYLCIFAATFTVAVGRAVRERAWKSLGVLAVVATATGFTTAPSRHPLDHRAALYAQHLHEGLQLTRVGAYDEAIAAYVRARDLWPEDFECHLSLGVAYRDRGDLERSLAALEVAMSRQQADPDVPYQLGVTLHNLGRFADAERAMIESLRLNPRRGATVAYLGLIHAAQGRLAEARAELERGLALDPAQPQAYNNLGALLGLQGDVQGARRNFLKALEVDDTFTPARFNLAKSYLETGDTAAAGRELRRVMRETPDDPRAADLLRSIGG